MSINSSRSMGRHNRSFTMYIFTSMGADTQKHLDFSKTDLDWDCVTLFTHKWGDFDLVALNVIWDVI